MRVALFVSCLVDLFRPRVGFAAASLLERLGAEVVVPPAQTCCGQPAYNSGDFDTAREIARPLIDALGFYEHVVVPSGSCAGMLILHYPELFKAEPLWQAKAETLAARTRELSAFLAEHGGDKLIDASFAGKVAMHDSCSARRELGVHAQPRARATMPARCSCWPRPRSWIPTMNGCAWTPPKSCSQKANWKKPAGFSPAYAMMTWRRTRVPCSFWPRSRWRK